MMLTRSELLALRMMAMTPEERVDFALHAAATQQDWPAFDEVMPRLVDAGFVEHAKTPPAPGDIVATDGKGSIVVCRLTANGLAQLSALASN
jgi:hypothetical protein